MVVVVQKVENMGFSKQRASLLLDGLFNDCKYVYVLTMCDKQFCDKKEDWIRCHHCATPRATIDNRAYTWIRNATYFTI